MHMLDDTILQSTFSFPILDECMSRVVDARIFMYVLLFALFAFPMSVTVCVCHNLL